MNYLVTGATGYIGSVLVNAIDNNVTILSRKHVEGRSALIFDLESEVFPCDLLKGVDVIFHLAGFAHDVSHTSDKSGTYQSLNVDATVKLAKLAVRSGVKKFVFLSSVKAGGDPPSGRCAHEQDQSFVNNIYGSTKRKAELKLLEICGKSDMHISIVRSSLVYGPKVKGNLKLMLRGIQKGWFPPLPETGNRRSMIHVDDLVKAILLVAEDKRANGEIFIATDGTPHSSREIYNAMCGVLGKSIPKWSVPKTLFDIASLASPRIAYKLNKLLGDECYSPAKLEALGFKAKKALKDMNETDF